MYCSVSTADFGPSQVPHLLLYLDALIDMGLTWVETGPTGDARQRQETRQQLVS